MPRKGFNPDAGASHAPGIDTTVKKKPPSRAGRHKKPDAGPVPAKTPDHAPDAEPKEHLSPEEAAEQVEVRLQEVIKPFEQDLALYKAHPELLRASGKRLLQFVFAARGMTKSGRPDDLFLGRKALATSEELLNRYQSVLVEAGVDPLNPAKDFVHDPEQASAFLSDIRGALNRYGNNTPESDRTPKEFSSSGYWRGKPFENVPAQEKPSIQARETPEGRAARIKNQRIEDIKTGRELAELQLKRKLAHEQARLKDKLDETDSDDLLSPEQHLDPEPAPEPMGELAVASSIDRLDVSDRVKEALKREQKNFPDVDLGVTAQEVLADAPAALPGPETTLPPTEAASHTLAPGEHQRIVEEVLRRQEERRAKRQEEAPDHTPEQEEILATASSSSPDTPALLKSSYPQKEYPAVSWSDSEQKRPGFFGWLGGLFRRDTRPRPERRVNLLNPVDTSKAGQYTPEAGVILNQLIAEREQRLARLEEKKKTYAPIELTFLRRRWKGGLKDDIKTTKRTLRELYEIKEGKPIDLSKWGHEVFDDAVYRAEQEQWQQEEELKAA